jgi:hypothetical protein
MPSTGTLSADEIARVAAAAGFGKDEKTLATAVAVALAESSGRTSAVSPTGCCHGLWQINVEVHPYTKVQMQDPAQNAAAAWKISNGGTNWKPWSAYTNGMYLLHMPKGTASARKTTYQSGGDILTDELSDTFDDLSGVTQSIVAVKEWISNRDNIARIAKVLIGSVALIAGVNMVLKQPIQNVIKDVKQ